MGKRVIGRYRITFENGMFQEKSLISHEDYLKIIVPKNNEIYNLEIEDKKNNSKKISEIKSYLNSEFDENWFTDESPIFNAIKTHKLECGLSGKSYYVSIEKIDILNKCEEMLNKLHFLNIKITSVIAIAKIVKLKYPEADLHAMIFDGKLKQIRRQKEMQRTAFLKDQANQLPF